MDASTPVRFVTRRTIDTQTTPDGPRVHVTERWSDGAVTERVMGPKETAAHLRRQAGENA